MWILHEGEKNRKFTRKRGQQTVEQIQVEDVKRMLANEINDSNQHLHTLYTDMQEQGTV